MAQITKAEAITLIGRALVSQKQVDETDLQLVVRLRNTKRARADKQRDDQYARIDNELKEIAKKQYIVDNPELAETVEDLD